MISRINVTIQTNHAPFKQKYLWGNDQPFMTKTMRKAIVCHTKLKNIYHKNPSDRNLLKFRKQRNYCVKLLIKTKKDYYENLNINFITDNRKFWKYIKPPFSDKITTTSNFVIYDNDIKISDENEVAEKFNSYFSNIVLNLGIKEIANYSTCEDNIPDPVQMAIRKYSEHPSIVAINTNCLSEEKHCFNTLPNHDIPKVVSDIDVTKATSCQNIPTKIFKENIDLYIDVIGRIFNQGTIECKFPED